MQGSKMRKLPEEDDGKGGEHAVWGVKKESARNEDRHGGSDVGRVGDRSKGVHCDGVFKPDNVKKPSLGTGTPCATDEGTRDQCAIIGRIVLL